jgi:hypothetical protein
MNKWLLKFFALLICLGLSFGIIIGCASGPPGPPPPPKAAVKKPPKPRPGAVWVKGHWAWRRGRWVWISGHWK